MPWLALPFKDRSAKSELSSLFEVEGIPSLVVLDKKGTNGKRDVITTSGRPTLDTVGEFPWYPKPYGNLAETVECNGSDINEENALIVLCEGADDDEQKEIKEVIAKIAEARKDDEEKTLFFYADSSKGAVPRIRELCKLKDDGEITMLKLAIPDNGGFYVADKGTEITEDSILAFLKDSGERKQLA